MYYHCRIHTLSSTSTQRRRLQKPHRPKREDFLSRALSVFCCFSPSSRASIFRSWYLNRDTKSSRILYVFLRLWSWVFILQSSDAKVGSLNSLSMIVGFSVLEFDCMSDLVRSLCFVTNSKRPRWDFGLVIRSRGRWGKCGWFLQRMRRISRCLGVWLLFEWKKVGSLEGLDSEIAGEMQQEQRKKVRVSGSDLELSVSVEIVEKLSLVEIAFDLDLYASNQTSKKKPIFFFLFIISPTSSWNFYIEKDWGFWSDLELLGLRLSKKL